MTYEGVLILLSAICLAASSGVIIFLMYRIFDLLDENKSLAAMVHEYDKNVQIQKKPCRTLAENEYRKVRLYGRYDK